MFKKDIDTLFTNKIMEYIAKGYTLHTNTMSGCQGELAKVDLTNGNEVIRIYTDDVYRNGACYIVLTVGRNTNKLYNHPSDIIWNKDLEIIEQIEFVKLSDNYFINPEEYRGIHEKKRLRRRMKEENEVTVFDDKAKIIVLSFMKRQHKCKTIKLTDIQKVYKVTSTRYRNPDKTYTQYYVQDKNKRYVIK